MAKTKTYKVQSLAVTNKCLRELNSLCVRLPADTHVGTVENHGKNGKKWHFCENRKKIRAKSRQFT